MTSAVCAGYMSPRHCASSPDASSPRTRSSSRAIDPAQKPILSHRQKLSQANKNPRLTAGGFYLGAALCRRGDTALRWCSQSPPGSQRTGEPISPDRFHEILRSRTFRNMRPRYGLPGTAVSSGCLPSPALPPGTSRPRKKAPHDGGVFFYSGKSRRAASLP